MHRLFLNVGYDLSEQQLLPYFAKFGAIKDLYLPKYVSGRNKGYGFLTYASKSAPSSVAQQPRHVVDGIVVQVKLTGPRPVRESKPLITPCTHVYNDFGRGHRLYVGGVAEAVTREGVRHHFAKWGNVLDVYFAGAKGFSRSNYCFVTFDSDDSAQQAYRESERSIDGWVINVRTAVVQVCSAQSDIDPFWLLQPLKSINVAEDRKDDGHQASPLHMPHAADSESLPSYVSWLDLQHQHTMRQLATKEATNVPVVHHYSAGLPHYGHKCSQYPCGSETFPGGMGRNQVYWRAPIAHNNSLATTQAACVCQYWNGMSFPLPGSFEECTQEMEGSVADVGSTDTSLSLDNLALLAHQSILEAFGYNFSGEDSIPLPSFQEQCFDGEGYRSSPLN